MEGRNRVWFKTRKVGHRLLTSRAKTRPDVTLIFASAPGRVRLRPRPHSQRRFSNIRRDLPRLVLREQLGRNVRFTPRTLISTAVMSALCQKRTFQRVRGIRFASKSGRQLQLIELQPSRLRQLDVRVNLLGNHGIKFLWADGHRFDTLRRKFGSHRGQCQRVLNLNVQLFDN